MNEKIENIINELDNITKNSPDENYVNKLVIVKLILKSYDTTIYLDEDELSKEINEIIENFYI